MKMLLVLMITLLMSILVIASVTAPEIIGKSIVDPPSITAISITSGEKNETDDNQTTQKQTNETPPDKNTTAHDPGITIMEIVSNNEKEVPANDDLPLKEETADEESSSVGFGDGIKGTRLPEKKEEKSKEKQTVKEKYAELLISPVESDEDLELYAAATVATDENIEEIKVSDDQIVMKYKQPAKLLGFIPIDYTATTTVEDEGIKFHSPWWLIIASDNSKDLKAEVEKAAPKGDDAQLSNIDLQNVLQKQQIIQIISSIMKNTE